MRQMFDLFKPWPIRPLPLAVLLSLFQLLVNSAIVIATSRAQGRYATLQEIVVTIPSVVLGFIFAFCSLWFVRWLGEILPGIKPLLYWLGALLFGVSLASARVLSINDLTPDFWRDPASWWRIFGAAILVYLTVHISLGVSNKKLSEQVELAKAAKTALEIQRSRLITAQEQVRRQIADFLHDRLQSDLVLLGIQMQRSVENLGEEEKGIAKAYIDEIERIRQFDVRSVSRQLSPELDGPSLKPAFEELLARYRKGFAIELALEESGTLPQSLKLAAYRLVEQALLNSATHSAANHVWVNVIESGNELLINVTNDGDPLPKNFTPGAGFAIFDDWVAQHDGSWSIASESSLTTFQARLKIPNK